LVAGAPADRRGDASLARSSLVQERQQRGLAFGNLGAQIRR